MAYAMETNQDLAYFASAALLALEKCAARIDALRIFYGLVDDDATENKK